jgi:anti-anti-sigma regulatory factor
MKRTGKKPTREAATYDLGGDLTIRSVQAHKEGLRALLADQGTVTLQAGAVEHVDTAGLQLVAAFVVQMLGAGRELHWNEPASPLTEAAASLGLTSALHLAASG